MKEFLKSVAEHYFGHIAQQPRQKQDWLEVTDYMFVFPSRRSGLFFEQYLYQIRNGVGAGQTPTTRIPVMSPQSTTIADLFSCFTEVRLADHTKLLFELYKVYTQVMADENSKAQERGEKAFFVQEDFDEFVFWCEMLLSDFADVDRYLADARQLFHNVRDLKEVDEIMGGPFAGLSDEAIKALQQFWKHVNPAQTGGEAKGSFRQTWSILYEVYERFRQTLREKGLAYDGMRQRDVVEAIPTGALEPYLQRLPKHIVFVGITAINQAERALMKWLKEQGVAEFCWDYADEHLRMDNASHRGETQAHAAFFTKQNLADFPNALSDEELVPYLFPEEKRQVTRIPVPSGVGQTTEAARILRQWGTKDAIHTAVILADENLLVPMCYSIPEEFGTYNVTMGYSLRSTQAFTLVEALAELQNNYRASTRTYYYNSVLALLGHSYLLNLEPEVVPKLSNDIVKEGLFQVPVKRLQDASPLLGLLFRPAQSLSEMRAYLNEVFETLVNDNDASASSATENNENSPMSDLEQESLVCYAQQLHELEQHIDESGIPAEKLTRHTLIRMLQRLAGSQRVSFTGEPLSGLQVMGILETRALDFERIIILSMNEGVIPAKPSQNTFIPAALRSAFGLPTQRHKDSVLAYHFYRLISRAQKVSLLFDSRTKGMKSGEESRYLLQLKYLCKCKVEDRVASQTITTEEPEPIEIAKTPEVMKKLAAFVSGKGERCLSATSLKTYVTCPLQFYLGSVEGLREGDDLSDEMGDSQFGDIFHAAMQNLFEEAEGKRITTDNLKNLKRGNAIDQAIDKAFRKIMPNAERNGYFELVLRLVHQYVEGVIDHDMKLGPISYLKSEGKQVVKYQVNDALKVNLIAIYDRLDIVYDGQGRGILRVVDYKTGSPTKKLELGSMEELFCDNGKGSKEAFQVLIYLFLLQHASSQTLKDLNLEPGTDLNAYQLMQPHLYFTRQLMKQEEEKKTLLYDANGPMEDFSQVAAAFEKQLKQLIASIFDTKEPFRQCESSHACSYCAFRAMCGR